MTSSGKPSQNFQGETGLLAQDAGSGPPHLEKKKTPGNPEIGGHSLRVSSALGGRSHWN